jgi:hypothetical protein
VQRLEKKSSASVKDQILVVQSVVGHSTVSATLLTVTFKLIVNITKGQNEERKINLYEFRNKWEKKISNA